MNVNVNSIAIIEVGARMCGSVRVFANFGHLSPLYSLIFCEALQLFSSLNPTFFTKFLAAAVKSAMHVISDATCDIIDFVNIIVKITILNYGKLICRNLILKQVHFIVVSRFPYFFTNYEHIVFRNRQ